MSVREDLLAQAEALPTALRCPPIRSASEFVLTSFVPDDGKLKPVVGAWLAHKDRSVDRTWTRCYTSTSLPSVKSGLPIVPSKPSATWFGRPSTDCRLMCERLSTRLISSPAVEIAAQGEDGGHSGGEGCKGEGCEDVGPTRAHEIGGDGGGLQWPLRVVPERRGLDLTPLVPCRFRRRHHPV